MTKEEAHAIALKELGAPLSVRAFDAGYEAGSSALNEAVEIITGMQWGSGMVGEDYCLRCGMPSRAGHLSTCPIGDFLTKHSGGEKT